MIVTGTYPVAAVGLLSASIARGVPKQPRSTTSGTMANTGDSRVHAHGDVRPMTEDQTVSDELPCPGRKR